MRWIVLLLLGCSGKDSGVDPQETASTETEDSGDAYSSDPPGLQIEMDFVQGSATVDECAVFCVSVVVADDHVPVEGAVVDVWVGNDCIGPDLTTDGTGWAQACVVGLEPGEREVIAVVSHEGESVEHARDLSVRPFGYAAGIIRDETPVDTLPFVPNFSRHPDNPVLSPGEPESPDAAGVMLPSVASTDSGWVMWHARTPELDYTLGVATSEDGLTWTKQAGSPLGPTGETGSWRRYATNSPMLVQVGIDWRVYFTGRSDETGNLNIGMAVTDGPAVEGLYPENPVFQWSDSEVDWAGTAVAHPSIIHHPDGHLELWYSTGYHRIGYAYSLDGVEWTRHCKNPVFEGRGSGWEQGSVKSAEVVYSDGWYMMTYTGGPRGDFMLGWAMSRDGLNWTRTPTPVLAPPTTPGTWESSSVLGGSLVVDGETLRMYYSGTGVSGSAIGLATAPMTSLEPAR